MADARRGTVITVFSTASAVGKTLIGINMAAELAQQGYRVCLADLDLQFGDVCNYLQLQPTYTLADAVRAFEYDKENFRVKDFLTTYDRYNVPFGVLAAPLTLEEAYNIRTEIIKQVLLQLQLKFDFVVVDTASTFSEVNIMVMELSTIISFLGIVDFIPTIKNMKSGNDTLLGLGYDTNMIRMILNRSNSKTRIDLKDVEDLLGSEFYHVLPNDFGSATRSIKTGCPLVLEDKVSPLKTELRNLVARYMNRPLEEIEEKKSTSGSSWFSKLFK